MFYQVESKIQIQVGERGTKRKAMSQAPQSFAMMPRDKQETEVSKAPNLEPQCITGLERTFNVRS